MTYPGEGTVECPQHGTQGSAFICRHLNLETRVGFVEGYDPDDTGGQLYQAWCHECDEVLMREGDWNERSEAFARPRLVCRACYRQMRELNRSAGQGGEG